MPEVPPERNGQPASPQDPSLPGSKTSRPVGWASLIAASVLLLGFAAWLFLSGNQPRIELTMDQFWRELAERNIQELVVEESRGVITGKLRQTRSGDKPVEFEVSWPDRAFNDAFWAALRDAGIQTRAR